MQSQGLRDETYGSRSGEDACIAGRRDRADRKRRWHRLLRSGVAEENGHDVGRPQPDQQEALHRNRCQRCPAMRKLLVLCFGVLKTGRLFDPAIAMGC
jgi:hypothetical protein